MPNKKISELDQIVTIATGDQMLITDISEAEGMKSKLVTVQQLDDRYLSFDPTATPIGEMYNAGIPYTVEFPDIDEFVKIGGFTEESGINQGVTFSIADDNLTYNVSGKYSLTVSLAAFRSSGTGNRVCEIGVFINDVESTKLFAQRGFDADPGSVTFAGIVDIAEDDVIDLRMANTENTADVTVVACNVVSFGV